MFARILLEQIEIRLFKSGVGLNTNWSRGGKETDCGTMAGKLSNIPNSMLADIDSISKLMCCVKLIFVISCRSGSRVGSWPGLINKELNRKEE
jgi:hypothetical protein